MLTVFHLKASFLSSSVPSSLFVFFLVCVFCFFFHPGTGPGVWELRAQLASRDEKHKSKLTMALQAIPTATHMMLVKLVEVGMCCNIIKRSGYCRLVSQ